MGSMRAFYLAYSIYQQAVGKLEELPIFNIPWGHNIAIFEGVKSLEECLWFAPIWGLDGILTKMARLAFKSENMNL